MTRESQKARVREILRSSPTEGVCSLMWYAVGIPNGRTRIVELRDEDGLAIVTKPCDIARWHQGERVVAHVRYRWLWAGNPAQMTLALR